MLVFINIIVKSLPPVSAICLIRPAPLFCAPAQLQDGTDSWELIGKPGRNCLGRVDRAQGCALDGADVPQPPPTTKHSPASPIDLIAAPSCAGAAAHRRSIGKVLAALLLVASPLVSGCATLRTTDPPRTATEQFLMSVAATRAIDQLSADALRDRKVFIDTTYLTNLNEPGNATANGPTNDYRFLVGELRARLLMSGVRLMQHREDSQVVLEIRSGAVGIDRYEYLLGIPALYLNNLNG